MSFGIKFCGFNNYLYGLYKMSPEDFKNWGSRLANFIGLLQGPNEIAAQSLYLVPDKHLDLGKQQLRCKVL